MRRVIWSTALLMGVLLLGLTAGLWMQRRGTSPPEIVWLSVSEASQSSHRLTMVLPDDGRELWHKRRAEPGSVSSLGPSPDGQWLYLRGFELTANGYNLTTQRIGLNGSHVESLHTMSPVTPLFWSSDGQWVVYQQTDTNTQQAVLVRATPDGKIVQTLTSGSALSITLDPYHPPLVSPENDWIVFNGVDNVNRIYRLDIASGRITALTGNEKVAYGEGHFRNDTGDWLLVTLVNGYYRMRLDGSDLTPLLPIELTSGFEMALWPGNRLILIGVYDFDSTLYAVSMDDFSVRWSLPNMVLAPAPVGQSYVLAFGAEGAVYTIDANGQTKQVAPLFANMPTYELSPDDRWLVYTMSTHLYAVTLPDGQERHLFNGTNTLVMLEWAEDGESVVILEDAGTGISIWRMWLADGHKQRLVASQERGQYLGMGRLKDESVDGFILMDIGGVLFASAIVRLVRRRPS